MTEKDQPIYTSKPNARNIGQEYRLYADRIELELHLWGKVRVPLDEIDVCVRPPIVIGGSVPRRVSVQDHDPRLQGR